MCRRYAAEALVILFNNPVGFRKLHFFMRYLAIQWFSCAYTVLCEASGSIGSILF